MTTPSESSTKCPTLPSNPTSLLLECARQLEENGQIPAARNAYQAAGLADDTPGGRVELAGFHFCTECFDEAGQEYESLLRLATESNDRRLAEVARHNLTAILRKTEHSS
ncbi:MAG: hypothetical protein P8M20_08615, partial [Planctomycetaceae bacterium]|nr:hypothetical protein [Planctomycetaceae bacterium]